MKNYFLLLFAIVSLNTLIKAQDQIFKKDNTKILGKITEVNPEEIKYKLYNNLNGPTYTESKDNVSLIIYENGQHEVISSTPTAPAQGQSGQGYTPAYNPLSKSDSLKYYKYSESISINFMNFMNNEFGVIYQKDVFKSQYNIVIPLAVGVDKPTVTQSVYFGNSNNNNYYNNYYTGTYYNLNKKLFEVGFGINYYPSLKTNVNYFIGPVFRYMQYDGTQTFILRNGSNATNLTLTKNSTLTRYCMSITNGVIFRTKSRISASFFGSLGFKNDALSDVIIDPTNNNKTNPIGSAMSLYFWTGFTVGFCF